MGHARYIVSGDRHVNNLSLQPFLAAVIKQITMVNLKLLNKHHLLSKPIVHWCIFAENQFLDFRGGKCHKWWSGDCQMLQMAINADWLPSAQNEVIGI